MSDQPYEPDTTPALEILAASPLFKRLNRAMRAEIADDLELVTVSAGQALFQQGDPGDSMYIVDRGLLEVRLQDKGGVTRVLDRLDSGAAVGELALLTGQPRTADVVAVADSRLLRIDKSGFDTLTERHPEVASGIANSITPRIQRLRLAEILGRHFPGLDPITLLTLQEQMIWRRLADGEVLFRKGDLGTSMYIVINGHLQPTDPQHAGDLQFAADFAAGDIVGEYALLTDNPRSRTIHATRDTDIVEITRPLFERLAREHPQMMIELMRRIIARQQRSASATVTVMPRALTLAVLPAGRSPVNLNEFAATLSEHLVDIGSTALFTSERFDTEYGKTGAAQAEADDPLSILLNSWLQEQESRHEHIIYVADPGWNNWTRRCVAQADRIVLVGSAGGDAAIGPLESHDKRHALQSLVLLHAAGTREPSGTLRWLEPRDVVAHLHVREDDEQHWQRAARFLTGQAIGAVFSGTAARGLAQAGVIRAFEETGQHVDFIGGSSMGSLMGGAWALGMKAADFAQLASRVSNSRDLFDRTFPYTSALASRKISAVLYELFGERQIEDLWRPFFCLSTNLTTASLVIHDRGSLYRSIRASVAVPGLLTPILNEENELLVDGGVMNNFPMDVMAARPGIGLMIGVKAGVWPEDLNDYSFGDSISGWRALWSRVNPFSESMRVPTLAQIILRTLEVNSLHHRRGVERYADILIEPFTKDVQSFDFSAYDILEQRGYEAAIAAIADWRAEHADTPH